MDSAGQVEGALWRICDTLLPNELIQIFFDPNMNAAIEVSTTTLHGAIGSNIRPPPADGQFPPCGGGVGDGGDRDGGGDGGDGDDGGDRGDGGDGSAGGV